MIFSPATIAVCISPFLSSIFMFLRLNIILRLLPMMHVQPNKTHRVHRVRGLDYNEEFVPHLINLDVSLSFGRVAWVRLSF